jgi:protein TonB
MVVIPRRKVATRRRVLPLVPVGLLNARTSALDRIPNAAMLGFMLLASAGLHVLMAGGLNRSRGHRAASPARPIRVTVAPRPIPPPPKVVEEPAPPVLPPIHRRVTTSRSAASPPTLNPPPEIPTPPDPAPAAEAPLLMPGVALSATSVGGTMKVGIGGSPRGTPSGQSAGEGSAKPYHAREFSEAYGLTEEPTFLDNVSAEQVRRFYPEDARREKVEAVVHAKLLVDDDGSVVQIKILDDPGRGFGKAAKQLARLYKFKPARVDGRPVATEIVFTIRFELN